MNQQPNYNTYEAQNIHHKQQPIPNATASLVLGIIALVLCLMSILTVIAFILSIIGLTLGNKGLRQYKDAPSMFDESNLGQLKAGRVCSIIALCISGLFTACILIYLFIFFSGGF